MRKELFKSSILLILFTLAILYFAVFNWQIFIVKLNINLGFGIVEFPPFLVLSLLAFIIIAVLSWINYLARLRRMIYDLEHGAEVGKLRDQLETNRLKKFIFDERNLDLLREKLGVVKIQKKQEELVRLISGLGRSDLPGKKE
jgi:hypothetical protein